MLSNEFRRLEKTHKHFMARVYREYNEQVKGAHLLIDKYNDYKCISKSEEDLLKTMKFDAEFIAERVNMFKSVVDGNCAYHEFDI